MIVRWVGEHDAVRAVKGMQPYVALRRRTQPEVAAGGARRPARQRSLIVCSATISTSLSEARDRTLGPPASAETERPVSLHIVARLACTADAPGRDHAKPATAAWRGERWPLQESGLSSAEEASTWSMRSSRKISYGRTLQISSPRRRTTVRYQAHSPSLSARSGQGGESSCRQREPIAGDRR